MALLPHDRNHQLLDSEWGPRQEHGDASTKERKQETTR